MKIINITDEYVDTYCNCLEDWSEEMKESGNLKERMVSKETTEGITSKVGKK